MSGGAAHGAGIYLALNSSISSSYMVAGNTWQKSSIGKGGNLACIALVEVLDVRKDQNSPIKSFNDILTVSDESIHHQIFLHLFSSPRGQC